MTSVTMQGPGRAQLSKALKDKINNGALKYMEMKIMAEKFLGKIKDDSLEIVPRLAASVPRKIKNSENLQKQTFTNANLAPLKEIFHEFKSGHISCIGPAGSGKSTLLRTIARNVIDKKYESLLEVEVVVYNKCGDLDTSKTTTPSKLLLSNLQPQLSDNELKEFEDYTRDNPEKVLFMLDGLDNFPGYFYQTSKTPRGMRKHNFDPKPRKRVKDILCKIMEGSCFPASRVITSSRDNTELGQRKTCTVKVVSLVGLDITSIKQITYQYFSPKEAEDIQSYLLQRPALLNLCQTPMFLVFTLIGKKNDPEFAPTTMSEILLFLFNCLIRSEHSKLEKADIKNLEKLCFDLMRQGRVNFSVTDLQKYHLTVDKVYDLVITAPGGQDRTMLFVHQSILEVFACLNMSEMKNHIFKGNLEWLKDPHFAIVEQVLCGILLNDEIHSNLSSFLEVESLEEKKAILLDYLREYLDGLKAMPDPHPLFVLQLILSLNEAGESVDALIKRSLNAIVFNALFPFRVLSASDIRAIGSVTARCSKLDKLAINFSYIGDYHIEVLFACIEETQPKISRMELKANLLTPQGMMKLGRFIRSCSVKELSLAFSISMSELKLQSLKSALQDYQLCVFDISFDGDRLKESEMTEDNCDSFVKLKYNLAEDDKEVYCQLHSNEQFVVKLQSQIVMNFPKPGIWKEAPYEFTHAIGSFLNNVTERLDAYNWKFSTGGKDLLQRKLNDIGSEELKVFLADDLVLSARNIPEHYPKKVSGGVIHKESNVAKEVPLRAIDGTSPQGVEEDDQQPVRDGQDGDKQVMNEVEREPADDETQKSEPNFRSKLDDATSFTEIIKCFLEHKSEEFDWIQKFRISHHPIMEEELSKLSAILLKLKKLEEIELRHCDLENSVVTHLKELLTSTKSKVSTLCVTATSSMSEIITTICEIMKLCQTKGLKVEECEDCDFLGLLRDYIQKHELENFCKLDLSYNKGMEDFSTLGKILSGRITHLKMINCDLETEKLETLCENLSNSKVEYLDMSYNADLEEDDIRLLPDLLNKEKVQLLSLRGCGFCDDDLEAFEDTKFDAMQVHKIDLSYNGTLGAEGVEIVGRTVKKLHTQELYLGSCNLDKDCLQSLTTALGGYNLTHLDMRDNVKIASHAEMVADLVQQCTTKHLNMSQCKMGPHQIATFAEKLAKSKFKFATLNLSDSERIVDDTLIEVISKLIDIVDEELIVCLRNIEEKHKDRLQAVLNQSDNETIRIIYHRKKWQKNVEFLTLGGGNLSECLKKETLQ